MIKLKDVKKIYPMGKFEVRALDGISLSIKDGELISIMGPSGSGKSTLMHIIGCLDKPTEGEYLLDGKDVTTLDDDELELELDTDVEELDDEDELELELASVST